MTSPRILDYKYREFFGRAFNAHKDSYLLPADVLEHARLDLQHDILKYELGNSLYDAPDLVKNALRSGQSERPRVLDIGTGSGRWALEMAVEFPHADILGIDLAPPSLTEVSALPSNCRFEVRDANLPFDEFAGLFDVVHCRCIELGIVNFHGFLFNVAQTLKPGGILLLGSGYAQIFDEQHEPLPVTVEGDPKFTWLQRAAGEAYVAMHSRKDSAIDSKYNWNEWLEANPNYERHSIQNRFIAIGPWPSGLNDMQTYAAELMRYNFITVLQSYKPLLLRAGIPNVEVDHMIKCAIDEMRELKCHSYVKWISGWAIRSDAPWSGIPKNPVPNDSSPSVVLSEEYLKLKASRSSGSNLPTSSIAHECLDK